MARKQKHDYFKAFEQQAQFALDQAMLLCRVVEEFTDAASVKEYLPLAHDIEQKADAVNHENYAAIALDFITPIDRDDILHISQALDQVIDGIEEVIQEFYIMNVHFMHHDAIPLAHIIKRSCECMCVAVKEFPTPRKSPTFKQAVIDANTCEEEGDRLYAQCIRKLHTVDEENAMRVLVWSRIFTKMEACTDACENVIDIMSTSRLKTH